VDDRSLEGWAKVILKDRYGKEVIKDMSRRKPPQPPLDATWQELGMKPGIRVPGTVSWMAEWKECPNQSTMVRYALEVQKLVETLSELGVSNYLKKYLSGKWDPVDEPIIAAAIRRSPQWEAKYNQMEEHFMSKKRETVVKKAGEKAEGASLKNRIETLEEAMAEVKKDLATIFRAKTGKGTLVAVAKVKAETADQPMDAEIKIYLKNLEAAKEAGDNKKAAMIRGKLRKKGYSLRANGKK